MAKNLDDKEFEIAIRKLADRSKKAVEQDKNEKQTIDTVIFPFLRCLGFDPENDNEVITEYLIHEDSRQGERVDIAIILDNKPKIFIECKAAKISLPSDFWRQLFKYYNSAIPVKVAILMNGEEAWFYTDKPNAPNYMNDEPFFKFNIREYTDKEIGRLKWFCKEVFSSKEIKKLARDWQKEDKELAEKEENDNKIKKYILDNVKNPSEAFVRFIMKNAKTKPSQGKIAIFEPTVKSVFTELLQGDKQKIASPDNNAKPASTLSKDSKSNGKEQSKGSKTRKVENFRNQEPTRTLLRIYEEAIQRLGNGITMKKQDLSDRYSKNGKDFASIEPRKTSIQINLVLPKLENLTEEQAERQKEKMQIFGFNHRKQKKPRGVGNYEKLKITATEGEEFDEIIEQVKYAYDIA